MTLDPHIPQDQCLLAGTCSVQRTTDTCRAKLAMGYCTHPNKVLREEVVKACKVKYVVLPYEGYTKNLLKRGGWTQNKNNAWEKGGAGSSTLDTTAFPFNARTTAETRAASAEIFKIESGKRVNISACRNFMDYENAWDESSKKYSYFGLMDVWTTENCSSKVGEGPNKCRETTSYHQWHKGTKDNLLNCAKTCRDNFDEEHGKT